MDFVRPMSYFQNPPNHEARFGMNFHSMLLCERVFDNSVDEINLWVCWQPINTDSKSLGVDLLPTNIRKACRKYSTVRLLTISK